MRVLSHPSGAGQGDESTPVEQPLNPGHLGITTDERVARDADRRHQGPCPRLMAEDRGLDGTQLGRRLQTELFAEQPAEPLELPEGFGMPAISAEGPHEDSHRSLSERMIGHEELHRGRGLGRAAELQQRVGPKLGRVGAQLIESRGLRCDGGPVGQLLISTPPPQRPRSIQPFEDYGRLVFKLARFGEEALEAGGIQPVQGARSR
jgi:hypothetical protein